MKCPRCETVALLERDRDGVVVDICETCRGLWLDRGELEKLIARARRDAEEYEKEDRERRDEGRRDRDRKDYRSDDRKDYRGGDRDGYRKDYRDDDRDSDRDRDRDDDSYYGKSRKRKKEGWLESLGDLFGG